MCITIITVSHFLFPKHPKQSTLMKILTLNLIILCQHLPYKLRSKTSITVTVDVDNMVSSVSAIRTVSLSILTTTT